MLPAFDWNGGPLQLESLAGIVGIRTRAKAGQAGKGACASRLRPYAALCSDGLTAKIRSLWTAASVHVRASSMRASLLFLSFGLIGPAHCFLGILPELFRVFHCTLRDNAPCGACAYC